MTFCDNIQTLEYDNISVSAGSVMLDESESNTWGYYLLIENNSNKKISLMGKDWNITDEQGNNYNDSSIGFKGEIPEIEPGEYFEFSSTTYVPSNNAIFYGSCKILPEGQIETKDIKIPTFSLNSNKFDISSTIN